MFSSPGAAGAEYSVHSDVPETVKPAIEFPVHAAAGCVAVRFDMQIWVEDTDFGGIAKSAKNKRARYMDQFLSLDSWHYLLRYHTCLSTPQS